MTTGNYNDYQLTPTPLIFKPFVTGFKEAVPFNLPQLVKDRIPVPRFMFSATKLAYCRSFTTYGLGKVLTPFIHYVLCNSFDLDEDFQQLALCFCKC